MPILRLSIQFRKWARTASSVAALWLVLVAFQNCTSSFTPSEVSGSSVAASVGSLATTSLVRLPTGGIYSINNSGHACYFSDWNNYLLAGGSPDLTGVTPVSSLAPNVIVDGPCAQVSPLAQAPTNSVCTTCISFQVSAPTVTVWPSATTASLPQPAIPDNQYTVVAFPDHFVSYIADQYTYPLSGPSLTGLNIANSFHAQPAIGPGNAGSFDECGAWIEGAELIPGTSTVRAWYHGEAGYCHGETNPIPKKSVAYALSTDGGLTFSKVGSPDNLILSGTAQELAKASATVPGGNGDFNVVRQGAFYYMFYINASAGKSGLAVASVSSGGVPGSWVKWFNGTFSQPGVGGSSADIGPLLQGVSYNTRLQRFFGMTFQDATDLGFETAVSPDGVNWQTLYAPLIPTGSRWNDAPACAEGCAQYASIVAPDGSKNWDHIFYLYYLYIRPGDTFSTRFMVMRTVTMSVGSVPIPGPKVAVSLERYVSASANKHWVTTGLAIPKQGAWDFTDEGSLGGVFTLGEANLLELDDCVYGTESYLVGTGGNCGMGVTKQTTIGWIFPPNTSPQPTGTHPIYRCYASASDDHFVSKDANCEGSSTEMMLGYAINQ